MSRIAVIFNFHFTIFAINKGFSVQNYYLRL